MSEEVSVLFEIMQTTRSMRRLKPDPVPPALVRKILEAGVSAPSGGNMQRWRFLVVRDLKSRRRSEPTTNAPGTKWSARNTGRANQHRPQAESASSGCSTRPNTLPITFTKLRCGSFRVCRVQTQPERRGRQFTRQSRTCFWRRGRSVSERRSRPCI